MTHPPANDHRSDEDHGNSVTSERPGLEEMITEAEALRAQLAEAVQRATRLLAALKRQRRHRAWVVNLPVLDSQPSKIEGDRSCPFHLATGIATTKIVKIRHHRSGPVWKK